MDRLRNAPRRETWGMIKGEKETEGLNERDYVLSLVFLLNVWVKCLNGCGIEIHV